MLNLIQIDAQNAQGLTNTETYVKYSRITRMRRL